jgi:hypothetical protein
MISILRPSILQCFYFFLYLKNGKTCRCFEEHQHLEIRFWTTRFILPTAQAQIKSRFVSQRIVRIDNQDQEDTIFTNFAPEILDKNSLGLRNHKFCEYT